MLALHEKENNANPVMSPKLQRALVEEPTNKQENAGAMSCMRKLAAVEWRKKTNEMMCNKRSLSCLARF